MRSPGYAKVIQWLSEIWRDFETHTIANSFDFCGITSQSSLHSVLNEIYSNKSRPTDFVDDYTPGDELDGFNDDGLTI